MLLRSVRLLVAFPSLSDVLTVSLPFSSSPCCFQLLSSPSSVLFVSAPIGLALDFDRSNMHLPNISYAVSPAALLSAAGLLAGWLVSIAIYRLFFHPLANFPGKRLVALSKLYGSRTLWSLDRAEANDNRPEWYHDIVKGGRYWHEIDEMHQEYGTLMSTMNGLSC